MHCNHCSWLPYALQSLFLISIFITILVPDFQMHPIPYCSLPDALQSVFLISICIRFIIVHYALRSLFLISRCFPILVHYHMHYNPCSWFPDLLQSLFLISICFPILVLYYHIHYNSCSWFPDVCRMTRCHTSFAPHSAVSCSTCTSTGIHKNKSNQFSMPGSGPKSRSGSALKSKSSP